MASEAQFSKLHAAFASDGFRIKKWAHTASGRLGVLAEHTSAVNYDTGKKKTCYYLEGTPYERGYLLGLLAEPSVSDMATNFVDNILFDFIGLEFLNSFPLLNKLLVGLIQDMSRSTWLSQPRHIHDEAGGLIDGCKASNPNTPVTQERISVMNVGFDVLCALVYTGRILRSDFSPITPNDIRLSMMCNAFSVSSEAAGGGHYFGRDFMFVTAGTLQNNLAHIICRPDSGEGEAGFYPFVSVTAPGIIGSVSAMNSSGVAAGLNMSPAAGCDTERVGFNSLLLLRECVMRGGSAAEAAGVIQNARRGVSWNYALADGSSGTACTVEACAYHPPLDALSFPAKLLLPFLPDQSVLSARSPVPLKNGCMTRWCNAPFPDAFLGYNGRLWQHYNENSGASIRLHPDAFSHSGFINRTPQEKNCPSAFYFAPQRTGKNVLVTTNHFLMPYMRLFAMDPWCAEVASGNVNDIQWRYDMLNHLINQTLTEQGSISYSSAKQLIDFLAPYGRFPHYYDKNAKSRDGKTTRIEGCTSLFDLKARSAESHYGYYVDEWIKTTLPAYIG